MVLDLPDIPRAPDPAWHLLCRDFQPEPDQRVDAIRVTRFDDQWTAARFSDARAVMARPDLGINGWAIVNPGLLLLDDLGPLLSYGDDPEFDLQAQDQIWWRPSRRGT